MNKSFALYNEKNTVKQGYGLKEMLKKFLERKLPHRSPSLISFFIDQRLFLRIRILHEIAKKKKRKKQNCSMTLRGKRKLAATAH